MDGNTNSMNSESEEKCVDNKHLVKLPFDCLYHLGFDTAIHDLHSYFGDVKFVCMGGTTHRMQLLTDHLSDVLNLRLPIGQMYNDITIKKHRYSMYKVGPVIAVSHGMGQPSIAILLHEIFKLLNYAKCKDVTILRLGTSGGVGVAPGSLVITNKAVDGLLREKYEQFILGEVFLDDTTVDQSLVDEIKNVAEIELKNNYNIIIGGTMCCNDFYEGQGRLDGAFCRYSEDEKTKFFKRLQENNIVNIDMECTTLYAMCKKANIRCGIINVTLVDRLNTDQVTIDHETYEDFQHRPQILAGLYIKNKLNLQ